MQDLKKKSKTACFSTNKSGSNSQNRDAFSTSKGYPQKNTKGDYSISIFERNGRVHTLEFQWKGGAK
jgi:hypothetical protein